ncbi:MAG: hypothetical protein AB1715_00480 [Acidobacteriota bacterium]
MRRILLWFLAFMITGASAVYQRLTGPTYPFRGRISVGDEEIRFRLPRSADISQDCEVAVSVPAAEVEGRLLYQRFKTTDPWTEVSMTRGDGKLAGYLPKQPMAGKLAYKVVLTVRGTSVSLTGDEPIIIRFKGAVPMALLLSHVLVIFTGMLLSTRAGIAALDRRSNPRKFAVWALLFLLVGGFILGPLMQKYAFDALWTGFPIGSDLTDTKTLAAVLIWAIALVASRKGKPARGWILAASLVTLVVFLIPHSLLGSELKYTELKQ